jgi:aquaporin Z
MKKYLAEAIGTFFLVLVAGMSGDAFTIGVVLAIVVYATAAISGGHINPAVTLALWVNGKIEQTEALKYMASQAIGAVVASLLFRYMMGSTMAVSPAQGASWLQIGLGEALFTFLLASVVFHTAVSKKVAGNGYFGAAIGLTVFVGIMSVGGLTGGVFNPAVAFGPILVDTLAGGDTYMYLPLYLWSIFLGGALAGIVYNHFEASK